MILSFYLKSFLGREGKEKREGGKEEGVGREERNERRKERKK